MNTFFQAIKSTAAASGSSVATIYKILIEKSIFNDVKGGPYPKFRRSTLQKLTAQQKDSIRNAVKIIQMYLRNMISCCIQELVFGIQLAVTWQSFGSRLAVTWQSHGSSSSVSAVAQQLLCSCLVVAWKLLCIHLSVAWQSFGSCLTFNQQLLSSSFLNFFQNLDSWCVP